MSTVELQAEVNALREENRILKELLEQHYVKLNGIATTALEMRNDYPMHYYRFDATEEEDNTEGAEGVYGPLNESDDDTDDGVVEHIQGLRDFAKSQAQRFTVLSDN